MMMQEAVLSAVIYSGEVNDISEKTIVQTGTGASTCNITAVVERGCVQMNRVELSLPRQCQWIDYRRC